MPPKRKIVFPTSVLLTSGTARDPCAPDSGLRSGAGLLLLSDFGDDLLLTCLQRTKRMPKQRINCTDPVSTISLRIQLSMNEEPDPPPYNAKLLNREMTLFSRLVVTENFCQTLSTDVRLLLLDVPATGQGSSGSTPGPGSGTITAEISWWSTWKLLPSATWISRMQ